MVNDFVVKLQKKPGESSERYAQLVTHDILRALTLGRVKGKKPCIIFIEGASGEGKTILSARLLEIIEKVALEAFGEGLDLEKQYIYTPFEYPSKIKWILTDPEAKHKHILIFGEARNLVKSKTWYSLINQAVADVNAMSRTIKPLVFIVISQSIRDIDKEIRHTLNFLMSCSRPIGENTRVRMYRVYQTQSIDNPRLKKRRLQGTLINQDGTKKIILKRIIVKLPSKDIVARIEKLDYEHKLQIILKKLDALSMSLQKELPALSKLENLAESIIREASAISMVIKRKRGGGIKVRPEFKNIYNLTEREFREFEKLLSDKLVEQGVIEGAIPNDTATADK